MLGLLDPDNRARVPVFDRGRDLVPLCLSAWFPTVEQAMAVVDRVAAAGFALVQADRAPGHQDLLDLADLLTLGETLPIWAPQEFGCARTSMLLWADSPAPGHDQEPGGVVRLFNVTAALVEVSRRDPAAAQALLAPGTFAMVDGHLIACASRAAADMSIAGSRDPLAARRGLTLLDALARAGSPYYLELPVGAGQVLFLSCARIWHDTAGCRFRSDTMLHYPFRTDLVIAGR